MAFATSLHPPELATYLESLLGHYLPDGQDTRGLIAAHLPATLARVEHCFSRIHRKYYAHDGEVRFDHLNSDHMSAFLWFLGNTIWSATGDTVVPTKLFYLNKVMNGLDLYFSVPMPEIFLLVHPVGSVIGAARYGDYLVVYQNCTIGSDAGVYPRFGEGTILYARAGVIGDCEVGDDVVFAANSFVVNTPIPAKSIVVGQFPQQRVLDNPRSVRERLFEQAPLENT